MDVYILVDVCNTSLTYQMYGETNRMSPDDHYQDLFSTFGLFTSGFDRFDKAWEDGWFDRVFTTNLVYQKKELLEKKWYLTVNMERYIAALIDTANNGGSLINLVKPEGRIRQMLDAYKGDGNG